MAFNKLSEFGATNNFCNEVIFEKRPRKVYFDFDCYVDKKITNILKYPSVQNNINSIKKLLPKARLQISGSCGIPATEQKFKLSYHVVVSNYHFRDFEHQKENVVCWLIHCFDGFDMSVYGKNHSMKIPFQSKYKDSKNQR